MGRIGIEGLTYPKGMPLALCVSAGELEAIQVACTTEFITGRMGEK